MGPLDGVKVVEMAGLAPGPFGCMILADLGAQVLQVRRGGTAHAAIVPPEGPLDRGRRTVAIDLKQPAGLAVLLEVADLADVFVEGFRPGVAERLGIGPGVLRARNPRLVYGRLTGWGQDGPCAPRAGHDINYILMSFLHGMRASGLWQGGRGENILDGAAPFYDTYECADGRYVAVGCVEPQFYQQLLAGLGLDEEAAGLPGQLDFTGWDTLRALLAAKFKERSRDEWAAAFAGSDACVTPVLSPWEAHEHPHNVAREAFVPVGGQRQPASAPRFSRTSCPPPRPADEGGRDVTATLGSWGITAGRARQLLAEGVIS
jgi:alpha-methylacyl-CoA racemase